MNGDPEQPRRVAQQLTQPWVLAAGMVLLILVALSGFSSVFPETWRLPVGQFFDDIDGWLRDGRGRHPVYTSFLGPVTTLIDAALEETHAWLSLFGWPGVLLVVGVLSWRVATGRVAAVTVGALAAIALIGVWDDAMRTLALMIVASAVSLALGMPLGVLAGRSARVGSMLRPVFDAMQITPAYVYLLPMVVLFSIGDAAALVATVTFALPPIARLTALGIENVPNSALEVGSISGATDGQRLRTVQLPLALPSIRAGINQTIMMALSMAVIGGLIGGTGLGREVFRGLQTLDVGRSLDAGVAIVLIAVLLDRITYEAGAQSPRRRGRRLRGAKLSAGFIGAALIVGFLLGQTPLAASVPAAGMLSIADVANQAESFLRTTMQPFTSVFSAAVLRLLLDPLRAVMLFLPWWVLTAIVAVIAWRTAGQRVAAYSVGAMVVVGLLGVWPAAMNTTSQVIVAVMLSVVLAVPIGVVAAYNDWFERAIRPVLDTMQTMPAFVYLVPVVYLFSVGRVSGIIASVIYALPPGIRLTNAGIRQVPKGTIEAARSVGVTNWQLLRTVQLPIAKPTILMGVNQTTMMALAGVIIAGLIGAGGLGIEAVRGLTRGEVGRGVEAGMAIVLIGIILDRVTQGLGSGREAADAGDARAKAPITA